MLKYNELFLGVTNTTIRLPEDAIKTVKPNRALRDPN